MKFRSALLPILAAACLLGASGCGVIYSKQSYGSPATGTVSNGSNRSSVFANLGQPNAIYNGPSGDVFVYKYAEGTNVLGLWASIKRTDRVVVMDPAGTVSYVGDVAVGDGMTILAFPGLDATHPVRTETLLFDPENYTYEAVYEKSGE